LNHRVKFINFIYLLTLWFVGTGHLYCQNDEKVIDDLFKEVLKDLPDDLKTKVPPSDNLILKDHSAESSKLTEGVKIVTPKQTPLEKYKALSSNIITHTTYSKKIIPELKSFSEKYFHSELGLNHVFIEHEVEPGQYLSTIARKYHIHIDRIKIFNPDIEPNKIFPGQKIKIVQGPNLVLISKSAFKLFLFIQGYFYKEFPIGIGREGKDTPIMKTKISTSRAMFPTYTNPDTKITYPYGDPLNPVGTRWIGLTCGHGYGIHGTNDETSIGKSMSRGCIRMKQVDLELIYNLIYVGDDVEIRP